MDITTRGLERRRELKPASMVGWYDVRQLFKTAGDVLVSTPVIGALAAAYPAMRLDMLVSRNNVTAVETQSLLRRTWVYERTLGSMIAMAMSVIRQAPPAA